MQIIEKSVTKTENRKSGELTVYNEGPMAAMRLDIIISFLNTTFTTTLIPAQNGAEFCHFDLFHEHQVVLFFTDQSRKRILKDGVRFYMQRLPVLKN